MMDRAQLETIVKSMDTGTLVDMLRTQGIHIQQVAGEDGMGQDMGGEKTGGEIEPFSEIKIPMKSEQRPPINDPSTYLRDEGQSQAMRRPDYIQRQAPDMEPWNANTVAQAQVAR